MVASSARAAAMAASTIPWASACSCEMAAFLAASAAASASPWLLKGPSWPLRLVVLVLVTS